MNRLPFALLFALSAFASAGRAHAGYAEEWFRMKTIIPRGYVCFRATNTFTFDGRLAEPNWQTAPWTQDFADITGDSNQPPAFRTRLKMLWDESGLHIAAELDEPQVAGVLTSAASDLSDEDSFAVYLDTDGDSHDFWQFEINARGTSRLRRFDKPLKDGGRAQPFLPIEKLRAATHVAGTLNKPSDRDKGWTLEILFPWDMLGSETNRRAVLYDGDQWRINFCRVRWPKDNTGKPQRLASGVQPARWVWSPQGVADMHRPEKWGYLQFSRKKGGRARFMPESALAPRNVLQEVYYWQKDFQAKNRSWAASLVELGLDFHPTKEVETAPVIRLTPDGFEASVDGPNLGLKPLRWYIRQDGRFWYDPELRPQLNRYRRTTTEDDEP
jgi:hypothetical protein